MLLLLHLLLPFVWFVTAGRSLAPAAAEEKIPQFIIAGIVVAAVLQIGDASLVVLRDGASAWITLANLEGANENLLGLLFVVGLALLLPDESITNPSLRYGLIALLGLAVIWTFSRSSYLGLLAVAGAYSVRTLRGWLVFTVLAISLTGVAVVWPGIVEAPLARIAYTTQSGHLDASSQVRLDLWRASIETFFDHPLMGIGYGRSVASVRTDLSLDPSRLVYSHNFFVTLAVQMGIVGMALSILVFAAPLAASVRSLVRTRATQVRLATIAIAIASVFGEPLLVPPFLVVFMLIICGAVPQSRVQSR